MQSEVRTREVEAGACTMGTSAQEPDLWKQIDNAEFYLVSGSFEHAVSTVLSVSDRIHSTAVENACDNDELLEMLELAGMVLVQALKELRRTSEIFVQLKMIYGSLASIPLKVFVTGATMQMAEAAGSDLRPIFEEYLTKWRYTGDQVYALNEGKNSSSNGLVVTSVMPSEQYFEVAELYAVTFLSIVSHKTEIAISWAEKAELSEQDRQDLLKKLHALQSAENKKSTILGVKQSAQKNLSTSMNGSASLTHEDASKSSAPSYNGNAHGLKKGSLKSIQPPLQHVANQFDPFFWWFRSVRIKFGKIHIVLPSGKVMFLLSMMLSTIYVLRRRGAGLKRYGFLKRTIGFQIIKDILYVECLCDPNEFTFCEYALNRAAFQQISSMRRAFFDALSLAFSIQMNPLAAVQQVPQAPRGSW